MPVLKSQLSLTSACKHKSSAYQKVDLISAVLVSRIHKEVVCSIVPEAIQRHAPVLSKQEGSGTNNDDEDSVLSIPGAVFAAVFHTTGGLLGVPLGGILGKQK